MAEIRLVRIDFRLIHGQVVNKWIKISNSNRIIVIEDGLANNEFMKKVYLMAAPPKVKVDVYTKEDAIKRWNEDEFGDGRALILFQNVKDAYDIYKAGIKFDHLQIGGLGAGADRKLVFGPIALNKEDADLLSELNNEIRVYFHQVPDDPSGEYERVMSKIQF